MSIKEKLQIILSGISKREKIFFLLLTIAIGILLLWPLHNFQHYLSQGDHGRDLYCFKKTMEGALPYKDYSWLFGPLMPYYYSLCYLLGGVSIQSVLIGQGLLILLTGTFVYLSCAVFLSPALSFVAAFWYWSFRGSEFFYTYNHSGGILTLLVTLYCLLKYIKSSRIVYVYLGFFSTFLLTLIRLNMGGSTLIAFVASLILIDIVQKDPNAQTKRSQYVFLSLAVLSAASLIYWFLLHSLPGYAIYQSFPYSKSQRTDFSPSVLRTLNDAWQTIVSYFNATLAQKIFGTVLIVSAIQSFILILSKKLSQPLRKQIALAFTALLTFLFFSSHEYVASGVFYRLYWIFPLIFIIIFYLIGVATKKLSSPAIKALILAAFFLPVFLNSLHEYLKIQSLKNPAHQLHIGKNNIYTSQHPRWFKDVSDAVAFIKENTLPEDKILVLPLDPLYLFLSERDSATRQLVFFDHINIPEEQEKKIIREMEKTNWVIISNRSISLEPGMGVFGRDYCPLLAKYLSEHFVPVARFGEWTKHPGWAWDQGVQVMRRK